MLVKSDQMCPAFLEQMCPISFERRYVLFGGLNRQFLPTYPQSRESPQPSGENIHCIHAAAFPLGRCPVSWDVGTSWPATARGWKLIPRENCKQRLLKWCVGGSRQLICDQFWSRVIGWADPFFGVLQKFWSSIWKNVINFGQKWSNVGSLFWAKVTSIGKNVINFDQKW